MYLYRSEYKYNCGRCSPIWHQPLASMSCPDRPHTARLATPKQTHPAYRPSRQVHCLLVHKWQWGLNVLRITDTDIGVSVLPYSLHHHIHSALLVIPTTFQYSTLYIAVCCLLASIMARYGDKWGLCNVLEKKRISKKNFQQGFKPSTFWSLAECLYHEATRPLYKGAEDWLLTVAQSESPSQIQLFLSLWSGGPI